MTFLLRNFWGAGKTGDKAKPRTVNTKKGEGHIIVVGASPLDSAGKPIVLLGRCLDINGVLYLKFQV